MADTSDIRIREQKDLIAQLNITLRRQNLLIESLRKDKESDRKLLEELTEKITVLSEQIAYL